MTSILSPTAGIAPFATKTLTNRVLRRYIHIINQTQKDILLT